MHDYAVQRIHFNIMTLKKYTFTNNALISKLSLIE